MTWKLLFARDSGVWVVLFYLGGLLVLGTGMIENPQDYGIGEITFRWLKLAAAIVTAISGKIGLSWAPSTREIHMGGSGD